MFAFGINTTTNKEFTIKIDAVEAIRVLDLVESGEDHIIADILESKNDINESLVLDGLSWIDFIKEAKELLSSSSRFAISALGGEFGIGKNPCQAKLALVLNEF